MLGCSAGPTLARLLVPEVEAVLVVHRLFSDPEPAGDVRLRPALRSGMVYVGRLQHLVQASQCDYRRQSRFSIGAGRAFTMGLASSSSTPTSVNLA